MRTRTKIALQIAAIFLSALAIFSLAQVANAQKSSGVALSGKVSSEQEGPMEGVLVSAKREGSTITVTVVTDAQGRYSFPQNRLESGSYEFGLEQ